MADDQILDSWPAQILPEHTALVLVDLQNDFVHPDGWVAEQQIPGFMGDTGITSVLERASAIALADVGAGMDTPAGAVVMSRMRQCQIPTCV